MLIDPGGAQKEKPMKYAVIIEAGEHNYSAYVPDLPGCIATGKTLDEVKQLMREAIAFHFEGLREDGLPIPPATSLCEYVEL
jgi:predicted RNase H-like HicB family nuclease